MHRCPVPMLDIDFCSSHMRTRPEHLVVVGTMHEALGQRLGAAALVWLMHVTLLTTCRIQIQALATLMVTAACFSIKAPMRCACAADILPAGGLEWQSGSA